MRKKASTDKARIIKHGIEFYQTQSPIGQCVGADRKRLTHDLGWRIIRMGVGAMTCSGILMFVCAPIFMNLLTPVAEVVTGILRGKGDTLWPAVLNLISVWCVRIPLAMLLFERFGVIGAWIAMAAELNVRGILFLWRMSKAWKKVRTAA